MTLTKATTHTIYSTAGLRELGASSPQDLNARFDMEYHITRRRAANTDISLSRGAARRLALSVISNMFTEDQLAQLEIASGIQSGPSRDFWKDTPTFRIAIPPDEPDPGMAASPEYIIASLMKACRDTMNAYRFLTDELPSPASIYLDEADAVRYVLKLREETAANAHLRNLGFGRINLDQMMLTIERGRVSAGVLPFLHELPDDLEAFLVTLDNAAAITERHVVTPVEYPVTKPRLDFMAGGSAITVSDLPAITAHLAGYAVLPAIKITNLPGAADRVIYHENTYEIRTGFELGQEKASPGMILHAGLLPMEAAMSYKVRYALQSTSVPSTVDLWPEEQAWLQTIIQNPDPALIRDGITFFAVMRLLGACANDPGLAARNMLDILASEILRTSGMPDMDAWTAHYTSLLDGHGDILSKLMAQHNSKGLRVRIPPGEKPLANPSGPWRAPSMDAMPDAPAIRYCDLPALALRTTLETLQASWVLPFVHTVEIARNRSTSGCVPTANGLIVSVSIGWPQPAAEDTDLATQPAPAAAILQALLSACGAVRCAEQLALSGAPEPERTPDAALCAFIARAEGRAGELKLGMDITIASMSRAAAFCERHPEILDVYGFNGDAAIATWGNLAAYAGLIRPTGKYLNAGGVVGDLSAILERSR